MDLSTLAPGDRITTRDGSTARIEARAVDPDWILARWSWGELDLIHRKEISTRTDSRALAA